MHYLKIILRNALRHKLRTGLTVLGIFVAVQTLEGYVLTPRILGGRLNLHPMAVFLGLLIGGKLFGLLGVILAIPAIAIGKVRNTRVAAAAGILATLVAMFCWHVLPSARSMQNRSPAKRWFIFL